MVTYAITLDADGSSCGHGRHSLRVLLWHARAAPLRRRPLRLIVAGDFNLWPDDLPTRWLRRFGLVELGSHTAGARPPLDGCCGCPEPAVREHLWTHRNGNQPGVKHQQVDFLLVSEDLLDDLVSYGGGIESFPDAWEQSDHAPIYADFHVRPMVPSSLGGRLRRSTVPLRPCCN